MEPTGYRSTGRNLSSVANSHQKTKNHVANYTAYRLLGNVDVASALDEARQREIERHNQNASRYSKLLKHHIDVAVYLSAQGLAFRGHDESRDCSNRGNFLEMMDLLGDYSHELRMFLDAERITYTSHEPQNQLIECIYHEVRGEIHNRINNSKFISILMDDTSDLSNTEQSAISVRLIHNGKIEEHFLGLIDSSGDQSADGLTKILIETLRSYNITVETCKTKLIGQSYDGAPTMSGEFNGVQKQVSDKYPYAYYNHCVAHRISLCASHSANRIPEVAKFFGTLDRLVTFFRSSPKRTRFLGHNLPKPGDTRWLSRDTAVIAIDTFYETIGTALYEVSVNSREKAETQATARGLVSSIQNADFICFLKLYRKIFEHCSPIIVMMQKTTIDAVQVRSMLNDFQRFLASIDFDVIWNETLETDPYFPVTRATTGWRRMEQEGNGSQQSWKHTLSIVAGKICSEFSNQVSWRFQNIDKFKWMDIIHPSKFTENRKLPSKDIKVMIREFMNLYPFALDDVSSIENNLDVLYKNKEISLLLSKHANERDKNMKRQKAKQKRINESYEAEPTADDEVTEEEPRNVEENDEFEAGDYTGLDIECVNEGALCIQDLLTVIQDTGLADALPQAMLLLEIAAVTPLTSVHCERVFSRMKRVVSASRSRMQQARKEHLVMLQVEHGLLRWLSKQPTFYENIVTRFKGKNQRRLERFSRK